MIIIGERINGSREEIKKAIEERDKDFLKKVASQQVESGANVLDVNCGSEEKDEAKLMKWLVETVQEAVDVHLCLDSANPEVIESGLKSCHQPSSAWVNSITMERNRIEGMLPLAEEYQSRVVALLMDENGIPDEAGKRLRAAENLMKKIDNYKIPWERIYFDPLVEPLAISTKKILVTLETIKLLKSNFPEINIILSLSGVSFGLPARRLLNRTFLPILFYLGTEAIILDPLDKELMSTIKASLALLNQDEFCLQYIQAYREGKLVV